MPERSGPSPKQRKVPPFGLALNRDGCRNVTSWPAYHALSIRSCPPGPAAAGPATRKAAAAAAAAIKVMRRMLIVRLLRSLWIDPGANLRGAAARVMTRPDALLGGVGAR